MEPPSPKRPPQGLGPRLREARLRLNLSQKQVAAMVGVKPPMISFLENNYRVCSTTVAERLARVLMLDGETAGQLAAASNPHAGYSRIERMIHWEPQPAPEGWQMPVRQPREDGGWGAMTWRCSRCGLALDRSRDECWRCHEPREAPKAEGLVTPLQSV